MLINFINKLSDLDDDGRHIGQDPVVPRAYPDIVEIVISDDDEEQLRMPEDMEDSDKTPTM